MKIRFFAIFMIVALLFAACGKTDTPETQGTKETTGTSSNGETTTPDAPLETNGSGVIYYTTPDGELVIQLPDDDFDDDTEVIFSSRPLGSDVAEATEPIETEPSAPQNTTPNWRPTTLPDDDFE